ncbi:acetyl-coenzyme A synthetase 2, variant 3 [Entomophthora muscae]|uniref:Acetyl-coenzyme A synthetase 2, variant 3 n=2 Tax=Entomophthora muscae TaxID=34485 RepID=A0ACC2U117_9FUNG|nr:acetyl-coenzyme A synthetase 2, variant 3 [Entomophthora muscae]
MSGSKVIKNLVFVTGNANKLAEVQAILKTSPISITSHKLDLPELQGEVEEVAKEKCRKAAELLNGPVITEDTALCFDALKGLPGVYVKWFLEKLGHDGLNKILLGYESKNASAVCTFAYSEGPGFEPILFQGITKVWSSFLNIISVLTHNQGSIVPPQGPINFGWDPIFLPEGHSQTYAEMSSELKNTLSHRGKALALLREYFSKA